MYEEHPSQFLHHKDGSCLVNSVTYCLIGVKELFGWLASRQHLQPELFHAARLCSCEIPPPWWKPYTQHAGLGLAEAHGLRDGFGIVKGICSDIRRVLCSKLWQYLAASSNAYQWCMSIHLHVSVGSGMARSWPARSFQICV